MVVQNLHGYTVCLLLHSIQAYCDTIGHSHKAVIKYETHCVLYTLLPLNMQTLAQHVRAQTKVCMLYMRLWQATAELLHSLHTGTLTLQVVKNNCRSHTVRTYRL